MTDQNWAMPGEVMLACNRTVFCPCVPSFGSHPPVQGHDKTGGGIRVKMDWRGP